jgi:aryl-alcohol dehydrogenase-like predicted oxidoreductase
MTQLEAIKHRSLGQTGIQISPVGLGVMQFAGGAGLFGLAFPDLSQQEKNVIVRNALDGGINWFDTAEMYGFGRSEASLAAALRAAGKSSDDVVVATKWLPLLRTAGSIRKTIDDRLKHLDGYAIDLYMVHLPWSFSSPEAEMAAMADLVAAGKIRSVGVSNFSAADMRRAHGVLVKRGLTLAANQVEYSLLQRKIESNGVLETARELGVTIIAYTPLGYGILTGKYHRDPSLLEERSFFRRQRFRDQMEASRPLVSALEAIAERHGATPGQVALNWTAHFHGETIVAIPGATKPGHAAESAGAMRFQLSDEEMGELERLSRAFV